VDGLTSREIQALRLVAEGRTGKEAARAMNITHAGVKWHLAKAMKKLGARSRTEAVAISLKRGLLPER
jgi:DNA-binding CsgD family transcriptional regulator